MLGGNFEGATPPGAQEVTRTAARKIGLWVVRVRNGESGAVNRVLVGEQEFPESES